METLASLKQVVRYFLLVSSALILAVVAALVFGPADHAALPLLKPLLRVQLVAFAAAAVLASMEAIAGLDLDPLTRFLLQIGAGLTAGVLTCAVYGIALAEPASSELAKSLAQWLVKFVPVSILAMLLLDVGRRLSQALEKDGPPRFERNWGSLGNGAQGWRVSLSLTYLLMFLSVGGLFGYALQSLVASVDGPAPVAARKAPEPAAEPTKPEAPKPEPPKPEAPKPAPAKPEPAKPEPKQEAKKDEAR